MKEDVYESFSDDKSYDYGIVWLYVFIFFVFISSGMSLFDLEIFVFSSTFFIF